MIDVIKTNEALSRRWKRGYWKKRKLRMLDEVYMYDRMIGDKRHGIITEEEYLFRKIQGTLDCFLTHMERSAITNDIPV